MNLSGPIASAGAPPRVRSKPEHPDPNDPERDRQPGDLRACEEDRIPTSRSSMFSGTPPRVRSGRPSLQARRRVLDQRGIFVRVERRLPQSPSLCRTTAPSACAERTRVPPASFHPRSGHPRVCGEDTVSTTSSRQTTGAPPHVRRGPLRLPQPLSASPNKRDHLRACGADMTVSHHWLHATGTPPRMRSELAPMPARRCHHRITPARARRTTPKCAPMRCPRDHPRVCGADRNRTERPMRIMGSPPRACAGQTL